MSYIDRLRQYRSGRTATVHKFLTNYDPNSDRIYAFVEGDADEVFYRAQMQKYVPDQKLIHTYNCDGKAGVADAYKEVVARYPKCERVLFFLDKDVDDIVGIQWPSDPRIFVTEYYSIENYLVSRDILIRYLKDFVKIRRVDVDIDQFLNNFDDEIKRFYRLIMPAMAWIVFMRRTGCRVVLQDIDLANLLRVTDDGTRKRPKRCAIAYLSKVTQVNGLSPSWKHLRATCAQLSRIGPKSYVRGKFEAWWFVEFTSRIIEGLQHVVKEAGGSLKIHSQLHISTYIQLLAGTIPTPAQLNKFLSFHIKPSAKPSNNPDTKGVLQKLTNLIKR